MGGALHTSEMKRAHVLIAAIGLLSPAAVAGAERSYSISDFERVRVIGPFRVDIVADRLTTARGKGSAEALNNVRLDVQGRTLFIRADRSGFGSASYKGPPAVISIRSPALREASLAGSGALSLTGMKGLRVSVVLEGSGTVSATNVQADRLDVGVIGTGTIALSGKTRNAIVTSRGAGSVKGDALIVDDLNINWESAGDGGFFATRAAKVTSIGTGNVTVSGNAACTVTNGGNGQVSCGD